jgi:NAD(P)-dependent dehydrogenase (short-subunit alcohol dehydrogenase family)
VRKASLLVRVRVRCSLRSAQAIALAFAAADASTIVITARSEGELDATRAEILKAAPSDAAPRVLTHVTDVTSTESVEALFVRLDREGVLPDVLVNNAGDGEHIQPLHLSDPAQWWGTWVRPAVCASAARRSCLRRR